MSRWFDMLAASSALPPVQNVQIVQNATTPPTFERFEHSEHIPANCESGDFEERAAIAQFDAGIPVAWVEGYAHLQTMPRPGDMPQPRWEQIINDAGLFLDRWAGEALALGWTGLHLFGVHPAKPYRAIYYAGLVSLLNGRPVIAITANTATIDCGQGIHQTYSRCPPKPGQVTLWELH
jgi:hypothetical protein